MMALNDAVFKQIKQQALNCLARREYAQGELHRKLLGKGFPAQIIDQVLKQLQENHILSDTRFLENFIHSRMHKGYGPLHIQQALQQRGLEGTWITETLVPHDSKWIAYARKARQKRFGQALPQDKREKMKQMRFLHYRGFTASQIQTALTESIED